MEPVAIVWFVFAVLLGTVEALTVSLVSIWLAFGCVCAAISSIWLDIPGQVAVFAVSSVILILLTRPLSNKLKVKKTERTNSDKYIGMTAEVCKAIDSIDGLGEVKVDGKIWSAKSADGSPIKEGQKVKILSIEGVKLIVEEVKTDEN